MRNIIDSAKAWYASQHGDRFLLDLKRWLDEVVPGAIVGARRPIDLPGGGVSDIDLIARDDQGLVVIECKAYAKSRSFMVGEPRAVMKRQSRMGDAMAQARQLASAFERSVASGMTEFPANLPVRALVCSPTVEFLLPLDRFGMERDRIPCILTPEELVTVLRPGLR